MNVLVLAGGSNIFNLKDGDYPLCMTEFNDTPLIELIVNSCKKIPEANFIFALNNKDIKLWHLDNILQLIVPDAKIIPISENTSGAACTALMSINIIDTEEELLILSANQFVDINFNDIVIEFRQKQLDAGTLVFDSVHPRYSYVRLDEKQEVVEATEKIPISRFATSGVYWFSKGNEFVKATKSMISKDASIDGKFYICPVFNEMILEHAHIGVHHLDTNKYYPLKTERQVQLLEAKMNKN